MKEDGKMMNIGINLPATDDAALHRGPISKLGGPEQSPQPTISVENEAKLNPEDSSFVMSGLQRLQDFAATAPSEIVIATSLIPEDGKELVEAAVNRAYLSACDGAPSTAKAYLDTTLKAIKFYTEHFPDAPQRASYERLAVDLAVWMEWDPAKASPEERLGMLEAAEFTKANPKPDYYVTMEDPTLVETFHPPVPFTAMEWLPSWLFNLFPAWFIQSFADSALAGKPVRHPVDHVAEAEALIRGIKEKL